MCPSGLSLVMWGLFRKQRDPLHSSCLASLALSAVSFRGPFWSSSTDSYKVLLLGQALGWAPEDPGITGWSVISKGRWEDNPKNTMCPLRAR